MASRNPATLRSTGTNRLGPTARPNLVCPSAARWLTASFVALRSSVDMHGAAIPSR